jgi:hypothetical protein
MTGRAEWGIVHANGDKGVLAVYSLSRARPLKIANFDARFANFGDKKRISDWKFTAAGQGILQQGEPLAQRTAALDAEAPDERPEPQAAKLPAPEPEHDPREAESANVQ